MSNLKFGRLAKRDDPKGRNLMMSHYVRDVPDPPLEINNLNRVYSKLGISDPKTLFPMLGNDQYGDCTFAGWGHFKTLANGLVGVKSIPDEKDTVNAYLKFTHGQDTGCNELDVMKKGKKCGILGEKVPFYIDVDPSNLKQIRQTIWLFGAVYMGFKVPQNCQQQFEDRVPWTPGPLTNDGHCVIAPSYTQDMFTNLTWGDTQEGTVPWWNTCVDEAWLIIFPETQNPIYLKDMGFDWDQLLANAKAIGKTNTVKHWFFNLFNNN